MYLVWEIWGVVLKACSIVVNAWALTGCCVCLCEGRCTGAFTPRGFGRTVLVGFFFVDLGLPNVLQHLQLIRFSVCFCCFRLGLFHGFCLVFLLLAS